MSNHRTQYDDAAHTYGIDVLYPKIHNVLLNAMANLDRLDANDHIERLQAADDEVLIKRYAADNMLERAEKAEDERDRALVACNDWMQGFNKVKAERDAILSDVREARDRTHGSARPSLTAILVDHTPGL